MHVQEQLRARANPVTPEVESEALKGARFLPESSIAQCATYREAVWLAWESCSSRGMTRNRLAEVCDLYPSRVTQYISPVTIDSRGRPRPDLPAEKISAFEAAVGNRAVSQWLNRRARLTIMEEMIASRA